MGVDGQATSAAAASAAHLLLPFVNHSTQGLHTSSWAAAAAADEPRLPEGINPLQQAPPPGGAVSASAAMAALPGAEEGFTARAVHRGIKISPDKLNMFAKLIRCGWSRAPHLLLVQLGRCCLLCAKPRRRAMTPPRGDHSAGWC